MRINRNRLSVMVSKIEGKKIQMNIAQIKEVQRCLLSILADEYREDDVINLLKRIKKEELKTR